MISKMEEEFFETAKKHTNMGEEFEQQLDSKTRTIYLCDEINEDTYRRFCFFFNRLDATEGDIYIHLTSFGGDVTPALGIYDLISNSKNLVIIKCYGHVYSAATVILQSSPLRLASEECRFLIHDVSGSLGYQKHQDLIYSAQEIKYLSNRLAQIYKKHSHLSIKQINKFLKSETYFSAKEALQFGFIDGYINRSEKEVVSASIVQNSKVALL